MSHEFLNAQSLSHAQLSAVLVGGLAASALFMLWIGYLLFRDRRKRRNKQKMTPSAPEKRVKKRRSG